MAGLVASIIAVIAGIAGVIWWIVSESGKPDSWGEDEDGD